jgi:hypothetical protein
LWPGGFFNFEMERNWASAVNPKTGALMPVNVSQTVPLPPGGIFGVPAWNFTQFFPLRWSDHRQVRHRHRHVG